MAVKKVCWQCGNPVKPVPGLYVLQCTNPDCGWSGENARQVEIDAKGEITKGIRKGEDN